MWVSLSMLWQSSHLLDGSSSLCMQELDLLHFLLTAFVILDIDQRNSLMLNWLVRRSSYLNMSKVCLLNQRVFNWDRSKNETRSWTSDKNGSLTPTQSWVETQLDLKPDVWSLRENFWLLIKVNIGPRWGIAWNGANYLQVSSLCCGILYGFYTSCSISSSNLLVDLLPLF